MGPKKAQIRRFFAIFSAVFPYIWPLAGPNIAEKDAALVKKALGRVWEGFGKKLNFQAVIKSAASAASLDLQGSPRTTARHADGGARGLPCKSREAALAADLITA